MITSEVYKCFPTNQGEKLKDFFNKKKFCILGCGGVGSLVADLLVRGGVRNLCLIDHDKIESKNIMSGKYFIKRNVREEKVSIIRDRLVSIVGKEYELNVEAVCKSYTPQGVSSENLGVVGEKLIQADVVICCTDDLSSKYRCSELCKDKIFTISGVEIVAEDFTSSVHAAWLAPGNVLSDLYPEPNENREGYGTENYSYGAIVSDCASLLMMVIMSGIIFDKDSFKVKREYKNLLDSQLDYSSV